MQSIYRNLIYFIIPRIVEILAHRFRRLGDIFRRYGAIIECPGDNCIDYSALRRVAERAAGGGCFALCTWREVEAHLALGCDGEDLSVMGRIQ